MPRFCRTYSKALVMYPPPQPSLLATQSTRFCGLRDSSFPVLRLSCPSRAPTELNAQHEPHWPYGDTRGDTGVADTRLQAPPAAPRVPGS